MVEGPLLLAPWAAPPPVVLLHQAILRTLLPLLHHYTPPLHPKNPFKISITAITMTTSTDTLLMLLHITKWMSYTSILTPVCCSLHCLIGCCMFTYCLIEGYTIIQCQPIQCTWLAPWGMIYWRYLMISLCLFLLLTSFSLGSFNYTIVGPLFSVYTHLSNIMMMMRYCTPFTCRKRKHTMKGPFADSREGKALCFGGGVFTWSVVSMMIIVCCMYFSNNVVKCSIIFIFFSFIPSSFFLSFFPFRNLLFFEREGGWSTLESGGS